jgi:phage baseplate assembly protein W
MSEFNDFILGKQFTFPFSFTSAGRVPISSDVELIRRSIASILTWPYGTRFFLGQYGSKLRELLEDPNDAQMLGLVKYYIVEAVTRWETRITDLEVPKIEQKDNRIDITLKYQIIQLAREDSFVFPFYTKVKF